MAPWQVPALGGGPTSAQTPGEPCHPPSFLPPNRMRVPRPPSEPHPREARVNRHISSKKSKNTHGKNQDSQGPQETQIATRPGPGGVRRALGAAGVYSWASWQQVAREDGLAASGTATRSPENIPLTSEEERGYLETVWTSWGKKKSFLNYGAVTVNVFLELKYKCQSSSTKLTTTT